MTQSADILYIKAFIFNGEEGLSMLRSPCVNCDRASEDKNKCLENCDKLKEYQEQLLKQGIYATM